MILGLGIILLFAYNWNVMPKAAKLALILFALVGAHAGDIWLWRRPGWHRQLGEALCVLGTMFFGAGIWLVAQIYHIDEHFPNGFLIWGLGALAMAWALPSPAHGLLAVVVLCIWNCTEAWDFQMPVHWGPLLLLLGPGALAWWQRSRWGANPWHWVHDGEPPPRPAPTHIHVLKPGQSYEMRVDFTDPHWFVVQSSSQPSGTATGTPLSQMTQTWGTHQFRLAYRPPDREATRSLPNAVLIWHGHLPSRAFTPAGVQD